MKKILILALLLSACDNDSFQKYTPPGPSTPYVKIDAYVLDGGIKIHSIDSQEPSTLLKSVDILGLGPNEVLMDIDIRPADGKVYGLSTQSKIYTINPEDGSTTLISTLSPILPSGVNYVIDFNPVVDRLRIIGENGDNLRVNFLSGVSIADSAINGLPSSSQINSIAYNDNFNANGRSTSLFTISNGSDKIYIQNPANSGTQTSSIGLGEDILSSAGFDLDEKNKAAAILLVGGIWSIHHFEISNPLSKLKVPLHPSIVNPKGFTFKAASNPTLIGLRKNNSIVQWRYNESDKVSNSINLDSPTPLFLAGEKVIGLDYRPSDNKYYFVTNLSRLFSFSFPTAGTSSVNPSLLGTIIYPNFSDYIQQGVNYIIDFNPTTSSNRLRIIGDDGSNGALNIETLMVTIQGSIKPSSAYLSAIAYNNNFSGANVSTLLALDASSGKLGFQTIKAGHSSDGTFNPISGLGMVAPVGVTGFDIVGNGNGYVTTKDGNFLDRVYELDLSKDLPTTSGGALIGNGLLDIIDVVQRF